MAETELMHDVRLSLDDLHALHHAVKRQMKHHQKSCDRLVAQLRDEPATPARTNALDMHLRNMIALQSTQVRLDAARSVAIEREAEITRLRKGAQRDG